MSGDFLKIVTARIGDAVDLQWVEVRDAANHPGMHESGLIPKIYLSDPKC